MVTDITNPEVPRNVISFTRESLIFMDSRVSLNSAFFPVRKKNTHTADAPWEITVAMAAPRTPISNPKIRTGSRMIFMTAPRRTVIIPIFPNPWALIKLFIPRLVITKTVPRR